MPRLRLVAAGAASGEPAGREHRIRRAGLLFFDHIGSVSDDRVEGQCGAYRVRCGAGDGGTFDIGLQALSGAAARNENLLYIVNNNGAYMNTGIQTSTATPYGAVTTTNPGGGFKKSWPKDLMGIVAAHNLPYAATASLAYLEDLRAKIEKAKKVQGFRLLMIDGPCPPGHKTDPAQSIAIARLAVESRLFPLFEIERQRYRISYRPERFVPVEECLRQQGRFRHLFQEGNRHMLADIQAFINRYWDKLSWQEEHSKKEEVEI